MLGSGISRPHEAAAGKLDAGLLRSSWQLPQWDEDEVVSVADQFRWRRAVGLGDETLMVMPCESGGESVEDRGG